MTTLSLRVSKATRLRIKTVAEAKQLKPSQVARAAINDYLDRFADEPDEEAQK
jgi:predicted transcriptional regulator